MNSLGAFLTRLGETRGESAPDAAYGPEDRMGNASLVLTVIGADRPGLVEALANTVADHGASWLESRMAHLAGHFVGLLRVSVADSRAAELAQALRGLEARGLRVIV